MFPQKYLLFLAFHISTCLGQGHKTLVGVAVLFRHGDRAPVFSFPTDQYANEKYFPEGLGQLLKIGAKHQYDLGRYLRERYKNFVSNEYRQNDMYVLSSDVDRTIMSAAANLAGFYRPSKNNTFEDGLLWTPVPVHTISVNEDGILAMYKNCPKYWNTFNREHYDQKMQFSEEYPDFFLTLMDYTGWSYEDITYFILSDILHGYKLHNIAYLPKWYDDLDKEFLAYITSLELSLYTSTKQQTRLHAGPFFRYLLDKFEGMFNRTTPKFLMLSAHDLTIVTVLGAMGAFEGDPPEFTASVIWELYEHNDGRKSMRLFYKKNVTSDAEPRAVKGCGVECNYNVFKSMMEPIAVDDVTWNQECKT